MDKQKYLSLIKDLSEAPGVSGFEDQVLTVLRSHGEGLGDWEEDSMRNLYLRRQGNRGQRPLLMLDAHTDEVGFMVRYIRSNGTLDFLPIGGWVPHTVAAHRVLVRNDQGSWIPGIVASRPPHFLSEAERKQSPDLSSMVIDVGASSEKEVREDYQISMAAPVVPDVAFEYRQAHDIMIGKAFDDRLGCGAILAALRELSGEDLGVDVCAAFAAQEEVGLRGATVSAQWVKPDIAIVFEGTPADDTLGDSSCIQTALKKGPMLRHIDNRMITNPRFQKLALNLARSREIPVQEAVRTGGSTNGGVIHLSGRAIPVIVIGVPARYIHTHYSIASLMDFQNVVRLAALIMRELNEEIIRGL
ncbi:MAG: M42 family peptidase [Treponema sp.]|nr:M42 family peptidase [Treponema sp.]